MDVNSNGTTTLNPERLNVGSGLTIRLSINLVEGVDNTFDSTGNDTNGSIPGFGEGSVITIQSDGSSVSYNGGVYQETITNAIFFQNGLPTGLNFDSNDSNSSFDLHVDWTSAQGGVWNAFLITDNSTIFVEGNFIVQN